MTEGSQSLVLCTLDSPSQLTRLIEPIKVASEAAMCDFDSITSCDVAVELPSPPAQPPPMRPPFAPPSPLSPASPPIAGTSRQLQLVVPGSPGMPTTTSPPQLPPFPPLLPSLYEHTMNVGVTRSFLISSGSNNASAGPQELGNRLAAQMSVECSETAISCPTAYASSPN